jgi:RNA polymerase sigma-70 factor (ECF subfamily)
LLCRKIFSGGRLVSNSRLLLHPLGCSNKILAGLDATDGPQTSPLDNGQQDPCETLEDAALIRSLQDGCEHSFEVLFARYWKLVFAIAWKTLRQRSEAEDVVQEVFFTIYQRSDRYDPSRASVRTWIAQFAHFKALARRKVLRAAAATNLDELKDFESGLLRFGRPDGVLERAAFVEQCLGKLNPRQRRTLELVHFDGYTLTEAAMILKQSLANTRNLYYRGMNALRALLQNPQKPSERNEPQLSAVLPEPDTESLLLGRSWRS